MCTQNKSINNLKLNSRYEDFESNAFTVILDLLGYVILKRDIPKNKGHSSRVEKINKEMLLEAT